MSEVQQPVNPGPMAASATTEPTAATATASEATADPVRNQETSALSPESRPEIGSGLTDGTTAAAPTAPNLTNVTKEEKVGKGEVAVTSHSINEGGLNYKAPGGLKGLIFSKKYFWFNDSPLEHKHLTTYLSNEKSKDIAHQNAAHATQTGKGLLFFAKRAEDKEHPQGIINLADITEIAKGNFNDFSVTLHGHKHQFQAINKSEKDAWLVSLETKHAEAKNDREGIVGSDGFKSTVENYGTTSGAATTGTSRSLSRPKKDKSRERKTATTADSVADTNADTTAGTTAEHNSETVADKSTPAEAGEAVAGGAVAGAVADAAAHRHGSVSDEEKKNKKSHSQSRSKRGSLFGIRGGKKEEKEEKKEAKKEEKEEKKAAKAEEKAEKSEMKVEKKEFKKERELEKANDPLGTGHTPGFDAHAVAARVMGEPESTDEATSVAPLAATTEPAAAAETPTTSTTHETAPKANKRNSLFGGFFGKKETASPTATETAPAVVATDEPSTVSRDAPQLENLVTEPTSATAAHSVDTTQTPAAATAADTTSPASATTPTNRRSSFFSNLGTKKEKKAAATPDAEVTDGESKKSGGFGGLLRKASRAHPKNTGASGVVKDAPEVPSTTPPAAETTADGAAEGDKPVMSNGDTEANAMTESHEQTPVSAAA